MAKYKYASKSQYRPVQYLRFEEDEIKEIEVSDWIFESSPAGYLCKFYVSMENGEEVDKMWMIWDYDSTQELKKFLKGKKGKVRFRVQMHKEDLNSVFKIIK